MSKAKKRGRSARDGKHVRDYEWMLCCEAYQSLDCVQRCLLHELKRLYSGTNNGDLFLSVRRAAKLLGVNKDTAARAFKFLEHRGFIRARQKGHFDWKADANGEATNSPATTWILTEFEFANQVATKTFMAWKATAENLAWKPPAPIAKKKAGPKSGDTLSPKTGQHPSKKADFDADCPLKPDTFGQKRPDAVPLNGTQLVNQERGLKKGARAMRRAATQSDLRSISPFPTGPLTFINSPPGMATVSDEIASKNFGDRILSKIGAAE